MRNSCRFVEILVFFPNYATVINKVKGKEDSKYGNKGIRHMERKKWYKTHLVCTCQKNISNSKHSNITLS